MSLIKNSLNVETVETEICRKMTLRLTPGDGMKRSFILRHFGTSNTIDRQTVRARLFSEMAPGGKGRNERIIDTSISPVSYERGGKRLVNNLTKDKTDTAIGRVPCQQESWQ